jgi:hypothetical protein
MMAAHRSQRSPNARKENPAGCLRRGFSLRPPQPVHPGPGSVDGSWAVTRLVTCGALRFHLWGLPFSDALIRAWSIPMSLTKLAVAEAEINRRSEAARKGGDLAGMQQAMAELTALYRAYYGTPTRHRRSGEGRPTRR